MEWNWELADWPEFSWKAERLQRAEQLFLVESGVFNGVIKHLDPADREQITVEAISTEAVTTSEIEGGVLDRASVQLSVRRELGLAADARRSGPKERGVAEMMVDLHRSFAEPLSDDGLFRWHRMLLPDLPEAGQYRTSTEPMQVVSGPVHARKVHFEAPPSARVPREMRRFLAWFNGSAAGLGALTRAGIAHLYFESIHPFEDGNGRLGRAVSEKALAQALGRPTLIALPATILVRRKAYYEALARASRSNEVTEWLAWFASAAIEAQRRTTARIEFLIEKTRLLDRLRGQLNARQEKALLRMLREGPEGFQGGLSAGKYATITGASPATTTRDLADLVEKGALRRTGERRHARYFAEVPVGEAGAVTIGADGAVG